MKRFILFMLLPVVILFLFAGCNSSQDIPEGYWRSLQGRPSLILEKDSCGNYCAVVLHSTPNGHICPVSYPVIRENTGKCYIKAEGRIFISYSPGDSTLFLSPGGIYCLLKDTTFSFLKND